MALIAALLILGGQNAWPPVGAKQIIGGKLALGQAKFKATGDVTVKSGVLVINGGTITIGPAMPAPPALELVVLSTANGNIAQFGATTVTVKGGKVACVANKDTLAKSSTSTESGAPFHLAILNNGSVFGNGKLLGQGKPLKMPLIVGGNGWTGSLIGVVALPTPISPAIVANHARDARKGTYASVTESETVSVEVELVKFTVVPDPARIKPYRNALVSQEYKILSVTAGHQDGIAPGAKLRVLRWGIKDDAPTDVAKMKEGDRATLVLKKLSTDPNMVNEYQVDDLDYDLSLTYYIEANKS